MTLVLLDGFNSRSPGVALPLLPFCLQEAEFGSYSGLRTYKIHTKF